MDLKTGDRVKHAKRDLSDASFFGWSKSGKRMGIRHNYLKGAGVHYVVDYFDPKYIEKT